MTINRCNNCNEQQHVHEIIGITETIVNGCEGHNHRIATGGNGLEKFSDIKEGDIFEAFMMEEYRD